MILAAHPLAEFSAFFAAAITLLIFVAIALFRR